MTESVSERIVDQRLRNRIMEEVCSLSEGLRYIDIWGAREYFNAFFFQVNPPGQRDNSACNEEEHTAIDELWNLMDQAADATSENVENFELIQSGWPDRITPVAEMVLALLLRRGRFGEDEEEVDPSFEAGQEWYEAINRKAS